jgi:hypothetical protein
MLREQNKMYSKMSTKPFLKQPLLIFNLFIYYILDSNLQITRKKDEEWARTRGDVQFCDVNQSHH